MAQDIETLRERLKELQREKKEREEKERLIAEIKALEEEGTLKSKLKEVGKKFRSKLQDKGRKLKEDGDRLGKGSRPSNQGASGWNPAIVGMARESEFKAEKATEKDFDPPVAKLYK